METMHAAGRHTLPPVPRPARKSSARDRVAAGRVAVDEASIERFGPVAVAAAEPSRADLDAAQPLDAGQRFVARLRSAAAEFAEAAGAASAVVREAVPPARHRRSRCRVVLRYADDTESDVTFLGPAGEPGSPSRHGFERQIRRWLGTGQLRDDAWLVADPDAPDGVAVDVSAWVAAS
jgi:hypothetical protein